MQPVHGPGTRDAGRDRDVLFHHLRREFPLLAKVDVNGADRHPLYARLTETADADGGAGDVQWNFEKFLITPAGDVVNRFRPRTEPDAPR